MITPRNISEDTKTAIWNNVEQKRFGFENYGIRLFRRALNATVEDALKLITESINPSLMVHGAINAINSEPFTRAYLSLYKTVGGAFAKETYNSIKFGKIFYSKKENDVIQDLWLEYMQTFATTEAGRRITLVTGTTKDELLKATRYATEIGINEGLGVEQVGRLIRERIDAVNRYRAVRIARTEIVSASNRGSLLGAESTGLSLDKVWLSTRDKRTRDNHLIADGQRVTLMGNFNVAGEAMAYPGDPRASAENVINCRCTVIYQPLN